jgi:hypothetical protein
MSRLLVGLIRCRQYAIVTPTKEVPIVSNCIAVCGTHGSQPITDISTKEKNVVLSYSFPYEGMIVDAIVTLMPQADGKTGAQIAFASGAYVMTGTAVKQESKK